MLFSNMIISPIFSKELRRMGASARWSGPSASDPSAILSDENSVLTQSPTKSMFLSEERIPDSPQLAGVDSFNVRSELAGAHIRTSVHPNRMGWVTISEVDTNYIEAIEIETRIFRY
jgi:hypothetical protein